MTKEEVLKTIRGWQEELNYEEWTEPTEPFYRFGVKVRKRGDYVYVVDFADENSGRKERPDLHKYGPEELVRQVGESVLHKSDGIPWRKIVAEAPVKMGSSVKYADIVVLRNENLPVEPVNYFVIVETKKMDGDFEGAKSQVLSYATNSNAIQAIVFAGCGEKAFAKQEKFCKLSDGRFVKHSDEHKHSVGLHPDFPKLKKSLPGMVKEQIEYCRIMRENIIRDKNSFRQKHPQDPSGENYYGFWLSRVGYIEARLKEMKDADQ